MDNLENKKNVDTYIDKDKFQFITSFEKKEIFNTKGEKIIIDFGTLDIDERIFLSSFLTYVVQNDGAGKKINSSNLYDIIFDFNSTKKRKAGFYDAFISSISEFIRTKPHFISYIIDYYDEVIDNKSTIYRTQLNRSEMELLYEFEFRKSYKSLNNVLYIMGVAKSNITSRFLNKISFDRFYKTSPKLTQQRIEDIMEKLKVPYHISTKKKTLYFGNEFGVILDEKFYSEDKKNYLEQLNENEIISSLNKKTEEETPAEVKKEIVKEAPVKQEIVKQEPVKEETQENNPLNFDVSKMTIKEALYLGENRPFTMGIFKKLYEKDQEKTGWLGDTFEGLKNILTKKGLNPIDIIRKNIIKFDLDLTSIVKKYENLNMCLSGNKLGDNWKEIKDEARIELEALRNHICKKLSNVYDSDETETKPVYNLMVFYVAISAKKVLTCEI